jgi:predicted transcriptional regulator of viral defense system
MVKLVNRADFVSKIKDKKLVIFTSREMQVLFGTSRVATSGLLSRYTKKGFIIQIKRGLYSLSDNLPPELYLANKLYDPSYISREFALSYHGVIPDMVYEITSVSTKATRKFETLGKVYSYRRIKKTAFTGYTLEKQNNFSFRIADAEKAFIDTLYYRVIFGKKPISRFNKDKINKNKALKYAKLFGNPKLISVLKRTLN